MFVCSLPQLFYWIYIFCQIPWANWQRNKTVGHTRPLGWPDPAMNRAHKTHHKQVTIPLILGAHQTLVHRAPDQFLSGKPEASNAWNHSHSGWHTNSPDMHKSCNTRPHNLSKIKREPTLLKNSWNANIQKIRPIIKQTRHRMFPRLTQGATGGMAPSEPPGNPYSVCHNKFNNCNFI